MADGSVRANAALRGTQGAERRAPKLFSINVEYQIPQDAEPTDLLADLGCLAEAVEGGIQTLIHGLSDDGSPLQANPHDAVRLLYGVMYQVQMMGNLAAAAVRVGAQEKENGNG